MLFGSKFRIGVRVYIRFSMLLVSGCARVFIPELDMDWIHPWIGLDWVSKNGFMFNSDLYYFPLSLYHTQLLLSPLSE